MRRCEMDLSGLRFALWSSQRSLPQRYTEALRLHRWAREPPVV
jgi:hypothetical protein